MAKGTKKAQELTLEQVLWNCRVDFHRKIIKKEKNR